MNKQRRYRLLFQVLCLFKVLNASAQKDSVKLLTNVTLLYHKQNVLNAPTPAQVLDHNALSKLNASSVAEAASFFPGVQTKDYGGVGGLKTISVRSLGASNTGVQYDGIIVADAQTGQTDLGRFSSRFVQMLRLQQAGPDEVLNPARAFSATALVSISTTAFYPELIKEKQWEVGMKTGSFGLCQPSFGFHLPAGQRASFTLSSEAVLSKGNYPFQIHNGNLFQKVRRGNGATTSLQGESNLIVLLKDSSLLQVKLWAELERRGLPGAVVFFNDRSVQKLWNQDYFGQLRFQKKISKKTNLLLSSKYNHSYVRYTDADYLNGIGGLDNHYKQNEIYGSLALKQQLASFQIAWAGDLAFSGLASDLPNFAYPSRTSLWSTLAISYIKRLVRLQWNVLENSIWDRTQKGVAAASKHRLLPTVAFTIQPGKESPLRLRLFYKQVFRMPTFNDLYYNFIGNTGLRPEEAKQFNLGLTFAKYSVHQTSLKLTADAYYNEIRDKIVAVPNKSLFVWTMLNLGLVHIRGLDVNTEVNRRVFKSWSLLSRFAYTEQKAIDISKPGSPTFKNRIPYTPDHSGSGLVSLNRHEWIIGYSFLFSGSRYVLGENNPSNQLDSWFVQNVFIATAIRLKNTKAAIKIEMDNLANEVYEVVRFYPMPGRSFKISLQITNR